jgi:hypothetical protein
MTLSRTLDGSHISLIFNPVNFMNSTKTTVFFSILTLAILVNGCNAVNSVTNPSTPAAGSMTATVNGQAWSSTVVPLVSGGATATVQSGALLVVGESVALSTTPEQTLSILLVHPHLGVDSMSALNPTDANTGSFLYGTNSNDIYLSTLSYSLTMTNVGTINITQYDTTKKQISGTFSFTATQKDTTSHVLTVTNGSFYQVGW